MARCIPEDPDFSVGQSAERAVWERLRAELPDDAVLAHSVQARLGTNEHEIDLLVLWPGVGLAAIEGASAHLYPVLNAIPAFQRTVATMGFGRIVDFSDPESGAAFAWHYPEVERPDPAALDTLLDARFGWRGHVDAFERLYRGVLQ